MPTLGEKYPQLKMRDDIVKPADDINELQYDYDDNRVEEYYPVIEFTLAHNSNGLFNTGFYDTENNIPSYISYWQSRSKRINTPEVHKRIIQSIEAFIVSYLSNDQPFFYMPISQKYLESCDVPKRVFDRVKEYLIENQIIELIKIGDKYNERYTLFKLMKSIVLDDGAKIKTSKVLNQVVIKDADKKPLSLNQIRYRLQESEYELYKQAKKNLKLINNWLAGFEVKNHQGVYIPVCLRRIFNNGSINQGGRFYDSFQFLKKEYRKQFQLNGESTVSLDFKSMAIRLLYAEKGQILDSDPYTIEGYETAEYRSEIKQIVTRMLGVNQRNHVIGSLEEMYEKFPADSKDEIKQVMQAVVDAHSVIAEYFFRKSTALITQNQESRLLERILFEAKSKNLPVLPVHDCLICQSSKQDEVMKIMIEQFNLQYPRAKFDPKFSTYTLVEVE